MATSIDRRDPATVTAGLPGDPREQPSIGALLRSLVDDTVHLFRTEIKLAKAELRSNLTAAVGGLVAVAVGATLLLGAMFTLLGAAVGFLTPHVGAGPAALIVGTVTLVVGIGLVVAGGRRIGAASLAPDRALASLRESAETLKGND